jgi:UPF0755 protein
LSDFLQPKLPEPNLTKKDRTPTIFKILLPLSILTVTFIFIHNTFFLNDYLQKSNPQKVEVIIESGDSGSVIAAKLAQAGVIKEAKIFFRLALRDKRANSIPPGIHTLDLKISTETALNQLLDKDRNRGLVVIPEGLRVTEVLNLLYRSNLVIGKYDGTLKPNERFTNSGGITQLPKGVKNNLEGFLFPAQYAFTPGMSANQAVNQMLQRFELSAKKLKLADGYTNFSGKYSAFQIVTIASLIQAEGDPQDFGKVAQTIYNRLKIGMPLQIDASVSYALNLRSNLRVSLKQLETPSKYNTYKYRGLPIGPVCNPGEAALSAALNPTPGNWLYYVTVKPGDTRFTNNYSEFLAWRSEFQKNYAAGAFGNK